VHCYIFQNFESNQKRSPTSRHSMIVSAGHSKRRVILGGLSKLINLVIKKHLLGKNLTQVQKFKVFTDIVQTIPRFRSKFYRRYVHIAGMYTARIEKLCILYQDNAHVDNDSSVERILSRS